MAKCPNPKECPNQHLTGDKFGACTKCSIKLSTIEPEAKYSTPQIIGAVIGALCLFGVIFWAVQANSKPKPPKPDILFTLSGSNTIGAALMPALVTQFLKENQKIQQVEKYVFGKNDLVLFGKDEQGKSIGIAIKSAGSGSGFRDVRIGKADMIMSSRMVSNKDSLKNLEETVLCNDALAIVVHPKQNTNSLDKMAIANLFSGEARWTGLNTTKICARDANSGTWEFFEEKVLKATDKKLSASSQRYDAHDKLVHAVGKDSTAIGFASYQEAQKREKEGYIKILGVSDGNGAVVIFPNENTIKNESYPLTRRLFLYTNVQNELLKKFKTFALSDAGQKICEQQGFFGTISTEDPIPFKPMDGINYPNEYVNEVKNLKTMRYNIRFEFNKADLDTKAEQDGVKTVAWFKKNKKTALLIGFADSIGSDDRNTQLSIERAGVFKTYLEAQGISCEVAKGFGKQIPVGDNASEDGRAKNRRVEIWIK
jgi:phosphate transport system substrate-binding protein